MATSSVLVVVLRRETLFFGDEPRSLVTIFGWKTSFFGDETHSRRRFAMRNPHFWRRNPFSSPILGEKYHFLATRPILVVVLR
ncbi:hypothetical protein M4A92_06895 [Caldibacillus thermoamylovorans]|uniref:hypothetical protein n=1 Tax=Caldibacillus thermoamylovorans TaxID=35841 RepID=UPI0020423709|nr:hypothetical protein [Caldibacillus thermoamylovorans]MCM3798384.1 hypothetical protein [Caldibacillus thermoamylovorans]